MSNSIEIHVRRWEALKVEMVDVIDALDQNPNDKKMKERKVAIWEEQEKLRPLLSPSR